MNRFDEFNPLIAVVEHNRFSAAADWLGVAKGVGRHPYADVARQQAPARDAVNQWLTIVFFRYAAACLLLWSLAAGTMASPCVSGPVSRVDLQQSPLERRIHRAPPAVISLALKRNLANGVAIMPRPAAVDHPLIPVLRQMLAELPDALLELAREHVAAIYLVQGNFGSARVEAARNSQGSLIGGCMLLNLDALTRTANAWASWREGSAFHGDDGYRIQVTLERPQNDDTKHTLRFVFLHELGHILGMAARVHGFWAAPETWPITVQSPFTWLSWSTDGNEWSSVGKQRFPVLARPRFYRFESAPLPRSAAPLVYGALSATNWPSLYGSIDPYEDFAETFVLYVHTRLLNSPFRVDVYRGRNKLTEYRSCLDTGRCPGKRVFIERFLTAQSEVRKG